MTRPGPPRSPPVARSLAERVAAGQDPTEAVFATLDEELRMPGIILPIGEVPAVRTSEACVEGEIVELWTPSTPAIQQAGLIADEMGTIKFTIWTKSEQPMVRAGQRVRFRAAKKNW